MPQVSGCVAAVCAFSLGGGLSCTAVQDADWRSSGQKVVYFGSRVQKVVYFPSDNSDLLRSHFSVQSEVHYFWTVSGRILVFAGIPDSFDGNAQLDHDGGIGWACHKTRTPN
jgi:hypothetical protein